MTAARIQIRLRGPVTAEVDGATEALDVADLDAQPRCEREERGHERAARRGALAHVLVAALG